MTLDLPTSSKTSLSLNLISRTTKEFCSFCKERPFDLVCQCGEKFDFNCIGNHVETLNFERHKVHVAAGKALGELEATKKNLQFDTYRAAVDRWARQRIQDIQEIAEAAKTGLKKHEQIGTETDELADLYSKLDEIPDQSAHDRLAFVFEVKQHIQDMQSKLQSILSPTADFGELDEKLRAKLSSSTFSDANGDSHLANGGFDAVVSHVDPTDDDSIPMKRMVSPPTIERPLTNGFGRHEAHLSELSRRDLETASTARTEHSTVPLSTESQTHAPKHIPLPEEPAPSSLRFEAQLSTLTRDEPRPSTEVRTSFTGFVPAPREEVPVPASCAPRFEPPTPVVNPPVDPPKPTHISELPKVVPKPDIPIPQPADNGDSDEFDPGLSRNISRRVFKSISAKNDQNSGTLCTHGDQLLFVDCDETTKRPQVVYLPNLELPDDKLIMDWVPPSETGSSGGDEDSIRDIAYCDRNDTYLLITQTTIYTWNEIQDRFQEYHRMVGRQLKRITTDQQFIYLISASGRMTSRGDTIIFLTYDKEEVSKAFTDIIPSRMNRGTAPLNGEITDIAVGTRDQLMITYRIDRRSEVGICLFQVTNRGRDWSCVKQLQLNECWHASLNFTPRVEWSSKLDVFVLIEYMTGHLLMINQSGHVQGECRFIHNEGKSESPINLSISNRDWLCTRYDSMIVVKKLE